MFKYISLLLMCFLILFSALPAYACRCRFPTPETDLTTIKTVDAIVTLEVLDSQIDRGEMDENLYLPAKVRILKVFKGDLHEGQALTIWSAAYGSCTMGIGSGATVDVVLSIGEKGYMLGHACSGLSTEGWKKLKQEKK